MRLQPLFFTLVLCSVVSLSACTTWKEVPVPRAASKLHRGDKLYIKLKRGDSQHVKVKRVNQEGITDKHGNDFEFDDMRNISRKQVSGLKTGAAVLNTTAGVTVFAAATAIKVLLPLLGLAVSLAIVL